MTTPRAAFAFQRFPGEAITWLVVDTVRGMSLTRPYERVASPDGWARFAPCGDKSVTVELQGEDATSNITPPAWSIPAGMVLVDRALLIEAAAHAEIASSDPYEDTSDNHLAARLRVAAGP